MLKLKQAVPWSAMHLDVHTAQYGIERTGQLSVLALQFGISLCHLLHKLRSRRLQLLYLQLKPAHLGGLLLELRVDALRLHSLHLRVLR